MDYLRGIICGKFAVIVLRAVTVEVINRTHPHVLFEVINCAVPYTINSKKIVVRLVSVFLGLYAP